MENRQKKLKAWLLMEDIKSKDMAEALDVHPSMISRIIKGERAPVERLEQLVSQFGIPRELLPAPSDRKPGRPKLPKNKQ